MLTKSCLAFALLCALMLGACADRSPPAQEPGSARTAGTPPQAGDHDTASQRASATRSEQVVITLLTRDGELMTYVVQGAGPDTVKITRQHAGITDEVHER